MCICSCSARPQWGSSSSKFMPKRGRRRMSERERKKKHDKNKRQGKRIVMNLQLDCKTRRISILRFISFSQYIFIFPLFNPPLPLSPRPLPLLFLNASSRVTCSVCVFLDVTQVHYVTDVVSSTICCHTCWFYNTRLPGRFGSCRSALVALLCGVTRLFRGLFAPVFVALYRFFVIKRECFRFLFSFLLFSLLLLFFYGRWKRVCVCLWIDYRCVSML